MKKLIALITVLTMVCTMLLPVGITVSASTGWVNIFEADFDNTNPDFKAISYTLSVEVSIETQGDNTYANIKEQTSDWTYGGYVFGEAMTAGNYEISFDFKDISNIPNYGGVFLVDKENRVGAEFDEFRLLDLDGTLKVNRETLPGLVYAADKWYSYKMSINYTAGTYSVTVTDKTDSSNTGTLSGNLSNEKAYNVLMFGSSIDIDVDNIYVKKEVAAPVVLGMKYLDADGTEQKGFDLKTASMAISFSDAMIEETLDSAVTIGGNAVNGSLSTDKKTYTFDVSGLAAGNHTLVVSAETKSVHNISAVPFSKTLNKISGITLLAGDFDTSVPTLGQFDTNHGGPTTMKISGTDNKYAELSSPAWDAGGFAFANAMTTGKYTISLDFNALVDGAGYGCLRLTDDSFVGDEMQSEFKLLFVKAGKLYTGDSEYAINYDATKWYTFEMSIDRINNQWSATIAEKDNSAVSASASGAFVDKNINKIVLSYLSSVNVDNILVKKVVEIPEVAAVKYFDINGNECGALDLATEKIGVVFTEEMDEDSLENAVLINGKNVNGELSADGKTYTFSTETLELNKTYVLMVSQNAKSVYGANLKNVYSCTIKLYQGYVLLQGDFDTTIPTLDQFNTNDGGPTTMKISGTDNKYAELDSPKWDAGGFKFSDAMTTGKYTISLDFNALVDGAGYGGLRLTDDNFDGDGMNGEFKLVFLSTAGKLYTGDQEYAINYDATKWYTFEMTVDRMNNQWTATIAEKDNSAVTASASGAFVDKNVNKMFLSYFSSINIDNIMVAQVVDAPEVGAVTFIDEKGNEAKVANAATTAIKVSFTETMKPETLGAITLKKGDAAVSFTGSASADNRAYILTLAEDEILEVGAEYTLNVPETVLSAEDLAMVAYSRSIVVDNGLSLLNIDYDNNAPEIESFDVIGTAEYPVENGNKYLKYEWSWTNSGYSFSEVIPKNGGDYTVEFDFKDITPVGSGFADVLAITQKNCLAGDGENSAYAQLYLLGLSDGKFKVPNKTILEDVMYAPGTWYTYKLDFNRTTRAFTVTITQKDNAANTESFSGIFNDGLYDGGMYENRIYDAFKFYYGTSICLDNISVTKKSVAPSLSNSSVSFVDADGNVATDVNNVSLMTKDIVIDFGATINPRTIKNKVALKKGGADVAFDMVIDGTKLVITPVGGLEEKTVYSIPVSSGIATMDGKAITADFTAIFKTEGKTIKAVMTGVFTADGTTQIEELAALADGEVMVKLNAVNTNGSAETVDVIVAYYRANGSLAKVSKTKVTIENGANGEVTKNIVIAKTADTASVDIMCWKSLDSVKPMSQKIEF